MISAVDVDLTGRKTMLGGDVAHEPPERGLDRDCAAFLKWALPQLELRWPGFRKVRRQVCKRLARRMRDLGLENFAAYRAKLAVDPME